MSAHKRTSGAIRVNSTSSAKTRRNEPCVEVQNDTFSETAIQGLVEDWIVPRIVDRILETLTGDFAIATRCD